MPRNIRIVIWNIQEFGKGGEKYAARGDYSVYCNFLAYTLVRLQADVFIMQELTEEGVAHLNTLQTALNEHDPDTDDEDLDAPDWRYDYIAGSLVENATQRYTAEMLGWLRKAHFEGYALFWKHDPGQNRKFQMLLTREFLSEGGELGLVFQGRKVYSERATQDDRWFYAARYSAEKSVEYDLGFTATDRDTTDAPITVGNCRRPAYCVLDLNVQGQGVQRRHQLLPIVAFHSPVSPRVAGPGVQLATFSQPLYRVYDTADPNMPLIEPTQAILGGDFNVVFQPNHAPSTRLLRAIQSDFNDPYGGNERIDGANLKSRLINTPTICAWRTFPRNNPIVSDDVADYATRCIDHIFARSGPYTMMGGVLNMVRAVMQNGDLVTQATGRTLLQQMGGLINQLRTNGNYYRPYIGTTADRFQSAPCLRTSDDEEDERTGNVVRRPGGLLIPFVYWNPDFVTLLNELNRGYFTTPLAATQFIQELISDHFPTLVQVTIP